MVIVICYKVKEHQNDRVYPWDYGGKGIDTRCPKCLKQVNTLEYRILPLLSQESFKLEEIIIKLEIRAPIVVKKRAVEKRLKKMIDENLVTIDYYDKRYNLTQNGRERLDEIAKEYRERI